MREEGGYQKARNLLEKRYEQSYRIASTFVDNLVEGSTIKAEDGEVLRSFSILLTSCKNTLQDIGQPETVKAIVSRLPCGLRQNWQTRKTDHHWRPQQHYKLIIKPEVLTLKINRGGNNSPMESIGSTGDSSSPIELPEVYLQHFK